MIVRQTEAERLQTALDAVWDAYFTLVGREVQHAGRGRDGHLNVDDLEVLRQALLRATPPLTLRPPPADKSWIKIEGTDR